MIVGFDFATGGPTLCPVRICTGEACPGCGMTRAIASLIQGDLGEAMRLHPLAIVVALQAVVLLAIFVARATARRFGKLEDRFKNQQRADYWTLRIGVLNFVAFIGVWAARWKLGLLDAVV